MTMYVRELSESVQEEIRLHLSEVLDPCDVEVAMDSKYSDVKHMLK